MPRKSRISPWPQGRAGLTHCGSWTPCTPGYDTGWTTRVVCVRRPRHPGTHQSRGGLVWKPGEPPAPGVISCRVGGCTATYPRRFQATRVNHEAGARARGWRLGTRADGTADAICPKHAKPDPQLVALCRELAQPSTVEDRT